MRNFERIQYLRFHKNQQREMLWGKIKPLLPFLTL